MPSLCILYTVYCILRHRKWIKFLRAYLQSLVFAIIFFYSALNGISWINISERLIDYLRGMFVSCEYRLLAVCRSKNIDSAHSMRLTSLEYYTAMNLFKRKHRPKGKAMKRFSFANRRSIRGNWFIEKGMIKLVTLSLFEGWVIYEKKSCLLVLRSSPFSCWFSGSFCRVQFFNSG